jgi:hypothetical protein
MYWPNLSSAAFAFVATVLWWFSATIKLPHSFPLRVLSSHSLAEQVIGSQVISEGSSKELDDLGRAIIKQSRLSDWAAGAASASAILQALVFIIQGR